jgi:hypothetical protein
MLSPCLFADHRANVDADAFATRWVRLRPQFQQRLAAVVAGSRGSAGLAGSAAREGLRQAVVAAGPHVAAARVRPADPIGFGTVRSGFSLGRG